MEFDAAAIAEGVTNSAPGSTIETLVDLLDQAQNALQDAIYYRQDDLDGIPEGDGDREDVSATLAEHRRVAAAFAELRDAIVAEERRHGDTTSFRDRPDTAT